MSIEAIKLKYGWEKCPDQFVADVVLHLNAIDSYDDFFVNNVKWSVKCVYKKDQIVEHLGKLYTCKTNHFADYDSIDYTPTGFWKGDPTDCYSRPGNGDSALHFWNDVN